MDMLAPIICFLSSYMTGCLVMILLFSLISFVLFGIDKYKARHGLWRISERTLLLSAFFFGGIGAFLGMRVFRHKTQHLCFRILVPVFMVLQAAGIVLIAMI